MDIAQNNLGRFEIFRDRAFKHRFRLRSANNRIISQSEAYGSKQGAERGVLAIVRALHGVDGELVDADHGKEVRVDPVASSVTIAIEVRYV